MQRAVVGFYQDEEGHWAAGWSAGMGCMCGMILRGRCVSGC